MAYIFRNMSVLAYANGFTLWHYTTSDHSTTVSAGGYFGSAADLVRAGDMILANTDTGSGCATGVFVVTGIAYNAVEVSKIA